jgi:hypothetical protein
MIKTTKLYIVVFLALVLAHLPGFAQFNGGIGDGSHSDILSLTTCITPPHFYAFFGGTGDGAETNQHAPHHRIFTPLWAEQMTELVLSDLL